MRGPIEAALPFWLNRPDLEVWVIDPSLADNALRRESGAGVLGAASCVAASPARARRRGRAPAAGNAAAHVSARPLDLLCHRRAEPREVFAVDFRDRIVHHVLVSRLERVFEPAF